MAVDNQFKETVDALFKGMNGVVSSKSRCRRCDPHRRYDHSSAC